MDELHCVRPLDPVTYSLGEAAELVSCQCVPLFVVLTISHELAELEELTCVSVEDGHCLLEFAFDLSYPFGEAASLLALPFPARPLDFFDCHSDCW